MLFMGFLHLGVYVHGRVPDCTQHQYLNGLMPAHVKNLLAIPKQLAGSALCITAMQKTRHVSTCLSSYFLQQSECMLFGMACLAAGTGQAQGVKLPWDEFQIQQHGLSWG